MSSIRFGTMFLALLAAALLAVTGCGDDDTAGDNNNNENTNNVTVTCADTCPGVVAAGCANGPSDLADCETGCADAEAACPTEFDRVMLCAGDEPTFVCDASDMPYPEGCETEQSALYACLTGPQPTYCESVCPDVVAASCANGPPDVAECEIGCDDAQTSCPTEFAAVITCAGTNATWSCDTNNSPYPDGCQTEQDTLMACMMSP